MNFLADENLDAQIVARLRQDGHFVLYVQEMAPGIFLAPTLLRHGH
ncbi:MAG: hypothetical protein GY862_09745 [Gammaproteobacteria bacterium]|nr:hypothetical protein [Gammaproteobacteria bacterium]